MIILIPMGGKGERFVSSGYIEDKACILTTDRYTGKKLPMAVCAIKDALKIDKYINKIICVNNNIHEENGLEKKIKNLFSNTFFIHDHVKLDQGYACFLAREFLQTEEELFICSCDNGFDINNNEFNKIKKDFDVLMLSHTGNDCVALDPKAHSWAKLKPNSRELDIISIKNPISDNILSDHATTGMFWFKKSNEFLFYLEKMIWNKDTFNNKYYVDKVLQYFIDDGLKVGYFDVKYISWGTPQDYENYENTISYWKKFEEQEKTL